MKKTTAKSSSAKTPAPATKAVSSVKSAVKPAAKPAVKKVAAKKPAAVVPAPVAPVKKAPAVKVAKAAQPKVTVKPAAATTTIVVAVDVGFGNSLTIRGAGPGLSWDAGVALTCVDGAQWAITLPASEEPFVCKFLINDESWCLGEDYTVLPGASVVLTPVF